MKFFGYITRNARRNAVRSVLTISSIAICGFLLMLLLSLFSTNEEVRRSLREYNRVITMSAQGFAQPVPIAMVREVVQIDKSSGINGIATTPEGKPVVSPLSWYGGRFRDEQVTFAQFGCDPSTIFEIYEELRLPPDRLKAFQERLDGVAIGRKLAEEKNLKLGDPFPLKGTIYPFDLNLTVVAIFDGPSNRDLRSCFFNWDFLNEGLIRDFQGRGANNAGTVFMRCKNAAVIPRLCKAIDDATRNSDTATKTQTEEAFVSMFSEFIADLQTYINWVGLAVAGALIMICGVSMAMSIRERTTEMAVLKAIGFRKSQILLLVLSEAVLIASIGGVIGSIGTKFLFDAWDVSKYTGGFFPFFYVPWTVALLGLAVSFVIGFISGAVPAFRAASVPVVDGLRKVV